MKRTVNFDTKKIEYNTYGKKGKVFILLPGWTHDFQYDKKFIQELSARSRVITVSYPGYSGSEENYKAQSAKFLAGIISKIVTTEKLKSFTLVGFSFGCQVVLNYLKFYKKHNVILISPILHSLWYETPVFGKVILSSRILLNLIRKITSINHYLVNLAYSSISRVTEGKAKKSSFNKDKLTLNGAFDTLIATIGSFIDPVEYKTYVKFIFGEREIEQKRLKKLNIPFTVIKNSGHYPFEENYKSVVLLILRS